MVDNLPEGFYILGDPAYPLSSRLLISFSGTSPGAVDVDGGRDNYNFFHSQLRYVTDHRCLPSHFHYFPSDRFVFSITIERTFGQIVNRWGILWTPMRLSLPKAAAVVQCVLRLHNFGINWGLDHGKVHTFRGQPWTAPVQFARSSPQDPEGEAIDDERFVTFPTDPIEVAREEKERLRLRRLATGMAVDGVSDVREELRISINEDRHLFRPPTSTARRAAELF